MTEQITKEQNDSLLREAFGILGFQNRYEIISYSEYEKYLLSSADERHVLVFKLANSLLDQRADKINEQPALVVTTSLTQASECLVWLHNDLKNKASVSFDGPDQLSPTLVCSYVLDSMSVIISAREQ